MCGVGCMEVKIVMLMVDDVSTFDDVVLDMVFWGGGIVFPSPRNSRARKYKKNIRLTRLDSFEILYPKLCRLTNLGNFVSVLTCSIVRRFT